MNQERAKELLALYRGRPAEALDPEMAEALAMSETDPVLNQWLEEHLAFHAAVQKKLQSVQPPQDLKARLLASRKRVPPSMPWWRQPSWTRLTAVAAVLMAAMLGLMLAARKPATDGYSQFQARMVGTALRQYRMDIVTNDMAQVRQFLQAQGAPANYQVPQGLRHLQLTGAGALKWRNNPVSMVCFNRGDDQMLFLFIAKKEALKDPPPSVPETREVSDLLAVSWTEGDQVYLLAGPAEPDFQKKYIQ